MAIIMNILAALILVATITSGRQPPTSRRHYAMKITETGETFEETDDMDIDDNMEVIHVPAHNGLKEVTFVIDHNKHLTMRLVAGSSRCLLSPAVTNALDVSGEESEGDASDEAEALSREQDGREREVQTERHTYSIGDRVRDTERSRLSPVMQRLCQGRDINRLEPMDDVMAVESEAVAKRGVTLLDRPARHETGPQLVDPSALCAGGKMMTRCGMDTENCVYYVKMVRHFTCNTNVETEIPHATVLQKTAFRDVMKRHCTDTANKHYLHQVVCCKKCCTSTGGTLPYCDTFTPECK